VSAVTGEAVAVSDSVSESVAVAVPVTETAAATDVVDTSLRRGAGYAIVPIRPTGTATSCAQWRYRAPSGRASRSILPVANEAAARAISAVDTLPVTTERPRWLRDAGSPKAAQKAGADRTGVHLP